MTYSRNIQHIIFSTKYRRRTIFAKHNREAYEFFWEILKTRGIYVYRIGGVEDHVHILCDIPNTLSIAEVMKQLKGESSFRMRKAGLFPKFDGWQDGYYSRSCSGDEVPVIVDYIREQEEHHRILTWEEEIREFIARAGAIPGEKHSPPPSVG